MSLIVDNPALLRSPHSREALAVYERNSRHLDLGKLTAAELALIADLRATHSPMTSVRSHDLRDWAELERRCRAGMEA